MRDVQLSGWFITCLFCNETTQSPLEEAKFFVVFEPDIGENLSRFAERWGEDHNRTGCPASAAVSSAMAGTPTR
ncbi:MAG: hypothetical protein ABR612_14875 [Chromatocurvus sp.]